MTAARTAWIVLGLVALTAVSMSTGGRIGDATTVWNGTITVEGPVLIGPDETLVVEPGTTVRGPGGVTLEGSLTAEGTQDAPITWDTHLQADGPNATLTFTNTTFPGRWGNLSDPLCTLELASVQAHITASTFQNHSTAVCAGEGTELVFRGNVVRWNAFRITDPAHAPQVSYPEECRDEDCPTGNQTTAPPWGKPGEHEACWPLRGDLVACRGWGGTRAIELSWGSSALVEENVFEANHVALYITSADAVVANNTFRDNGAAVTVNTNRWEVERLKAEVRTGQPASVPGPGVRIRGNTFAGHGDPAAGDWPSEETGASVFLHLGGATGPPPDAEDTQPDPANATVVLTANTIRDGGVGIEILGWHHTALVEGNLLTRNGVGIRGHSASAYLLNNTFHEHTWDVYLDGYTGWVTATGGNLHEDKVHVAGASVLEADWGLVGAAGAGISLVALLLALTEAGRYWGLRLLVLPLYTRLSRSELLSHELREALLDKIRAEPGLHLRALVRSVDGSYSTVVYHLGRLETGGLVHSKRDGLKRRFHPVGMGEADPVHTSTRREILEAIRGAPGIHQGKVARELGISRQLVSYHVQNLEAEGEIRVDGEDGRNQLYVTGPEGLRGR